MLFLRLDQALELLQACQICEQHVANKTQRKQVILKQTLAVRYFMFNGLSPMELANARIEDLDPIECSLFLPRRHWKRNCITDIDSETVRLQIIYSQNRKKGPLLVSRKTKGHYTSRGLWDLIKRISNRTNIPNKEVITPLILKRTFAREYLLTPSNTVGSLQKQLGHKHLWSTAHYLRFLMEDVRRNHSQMMERIKREETKSVRLVS